jgi:hypothetical protein
LLTPPESSKLETKRLTKASLITGLVVGLPTIALFEACGRDLTEFTEIVSILPLVPFIVVAVTIVPAVFSCLKLLWPFIIVIFTGGVVFVFVYSL